MAWGRCSEPESRDPINRTTGAAEKSQRKKAAFPLLAVPRSFLEMMEARSRGHASPPAANGQSPSSGSQSPVVPPSAVSTGSSSPGTPQPAPQPPLHAPSAPPAPSEAPPPVVPAPPPRRSIISRLFGTSPAAEVAPSPPGRPWEQQPVGCGRRHPKLGGTLSCCSREPSQTRVGLLPPGQAAPQPRHTLSCLRACPVGPAGGHRARAGVCRPQSQPPLQRPQEKSRRWRILFLKTALTAASWKIQPPRRTRRKSQPRSCRTVTG